VFRRVVGGWQWKDIKGEPLSKDRLSGVINKLAAYRGTTCDIDLEQYVIRRINGEKTAEVERANEALREMIEAVVGMFGC